MADVNFGNLSAYERMLYGNVEDDPELEAELMAIQNEIGEEQDDVISGVRRTVASSSSTKQSQLSSAVRTARTVGEQNAMTQMDRLAKQVSEEINVSDDDNDPSVENDPELLSELSSLFTGSDPVLLPSRPAPPPIVPSLNPTTGEKSASAETSGRDLIVLVEDRLSNYHSAHKAAKEAGDAAKVRRLDRGLATLQGQLVQARSGKAVNRSEIPPAVPVAVAAPKNEPHSASSPQLEPVADTAPAPAVRESEANVGGFTEMKSRPDKSSTAETLYQRRDEFRRAAIDAKKGGQKDAALEYFKVCKQFDKVIEAYESGKDIDLSGMPSLSNFDQKQRSAAPAEPSASSSSPQVEEPTEENVNEEAAAAIFKAPPPPSTILEALQQRLEKYKAASEQAQQESNGSKARRMGRIQKQYEDAIKAHKAGKPVNFDELPTPPGFGPIPVPASSSTVATKAESPTSSQTDPNKASAVVPGQRRPSSASGAISKTVPPAKMSKQEQELKFLLERQQQFKAAALAAKKRGDIPTAKILLKQALGLDQMINACRNGLRVDISSVPTPPQLKTASAMTKPAIASVSLEIETLSYKAPPDEGTVLAKAGYEDVYSMLEQDLINQIQICDRNREFFLNTGDVGKVSEFEKVASSTKKDLAAVRNAFKHGDQPPRFHYETRIFPSIKCFPELGSDDLELSIVRGIQLKLPSGYEPKDADIYVKYELGYPKETPQTGKTAKAKGTNSPAFDFKTIMRINPKSRQFLHMLKRLGVKFEIMQKGGFLRSDVVLGTAEIKLLPLEMQPMLHQCLDVMENRKAVGGKLEVRIRVREPVVQKQAEQVKEKWLIIDQFAVTSNAGGLAAKRASAAQTFGSRQLGGRVK